MSGPDLARASSAGHPTASSSAPTGPRLPTAGGAGVTGTVLRLCSVFEPRPEVLGRPDAASFDVIGGMQNHTAELTRGLDRLGVVQRVVTSRLGGSRSRSPLGRAATVVRTGLPTRHARQLWAMDALREAVRTRGTGLVHAHQGEDLAVLPLAELVARRAGCPLVVTLHCSVWRTLDRSRTRPLTLLGPAVERAALRRADAVLVLTDSAAQHLVDEGLHPDRVHVLPSGYDPELFDRSYADPLPDVPRPRVLFLGRLADQKRPVDAVLAHALMGPEVSLVVVGDGPLRAAVEAAVADSPARHRVHLVGLVPHERVPAYLQHADAFVLPAQYEELGSVLVEAMAAGLPVVANDVGGIPDLVTDGVTGRLVERGDLPALAKALDESLADPSTAIAARAHVERQYAWPALARSVHDVYAAVQRG
jgi:2-deoxystreptamine N-acetyl-D-glucosaminyltransferase/2-deoxystreptamine glucosyltransferase